MDVLLNISPIVEHLFLDGLRCFQSNFIRIGDRNLPELYKGEEESLEYKVLKFSQFNILGWLKSVLWSPQHFFHFKGFLGAIATLTYFITWMKALFN